MDHIDADASAMRMQQPLKNGDQHLAIGWPVGHEGEPKCISFWIIAKMKKSLHIVSINHAAAPSGGFRGRGVAVW